MRPPEIDDLTLHLEPGQVVAMLGATGAGKSTIAKLAARFYDPAVGRVSIDGVDLRDLADAELRAAVTLITQESFLFSGSIADNIRVGRLGASRAQIEAAAEAVGADTFIRTLHDGYDTDVHKRGARLSAGQRQLIAFARALLVDPPVLVLDEATSALDIPTEKALQTALHTLLRGRTALVIAHRLSTIDIADRVLVIDGGRIVADGSPAELLRTADAAFTGLYRDAHGQAQHPPRMGEG
jgi:ATP-binding cassette subfamily B protein